MYKTLESLVIKHWMWPLLAAVGTGMISRLWVWWCFSRLSKNLGHVWDQQQDTYGGLCYLVHFPQGHPKGNAIQFNKVSDLRFDDFKLALRWARWSWFSGKAAEHIRYLEETLKELQEQPEYNLPEDRALAARNYKDNIIRFAICWDIAQDLTKWKYDRKVHSTVERAQEVLEEKYGLVLDRYDARDLYMEQSGIAPPSLLESEAVFRSIVEKVKNRET